MLILRSALVSAVLNALLAAVALASQSYINGYDGYALSFPNPPWELTPATMKGERIIIRNFPDASYGPLSRLPTGGVEIIVAPLPSKTNEFDELRHISRDGRSITWAKSAPARVSYTDEDPTNGMVRVVLLAPRKGDRLFYLALMYRVDDPRGPTYEKILTDIAASIRFTPR
jgi:hypothetical protein